MKRIAILLAVLMLCCAAAACPAEEADAGILAALEAAGMTDAAQLQTWGNTAACIARKDGEKALCVLEQRDGRWTLTVSNPRALRQDLEDPRLYLDSDQAIFWTYQMDDMFIQYHCGRETGGEWETVDETVTEPVGDYLRVYLIAWQAEHGGEVVWQMRLEDENENLIREEQPKYLPAPWLKDCILLNDFDIERFPAEFPAE